MQALSVEYSQLSYTSALISGGSKIPPLSRDASLGTDAGKGAGRDLSRSAMDQLKLYNGIGTLMAAEHLEYDSLKITFTSKDGDTVQLHGLGNASLATGKSNGNDKDQKELIKYIKESLVSLRQEILKGFVESQGGEFKEVDFNNQEVADLEAAMPEYWNAENTSQRIVDFATSFFSLSKMSVDDYVEMMKGAIDQGFGQAVDEMDELPGAVNGLISKTHNLAMEKLQAWADSMKNPQVSAEV